jgi:hypothetical protein
MDRRMTVVFGFVVLWAAACAGGKGAAGGQPVWAAGNCQAQLKADGTLGVCAVVTLVKAKAPQNVKEILGAAVAQGKEQLVTNLGGFLQRLLERCAESCSALAEPGLKERALGNVTTAALESVKATGMTATPEGDLKVLLVLDADAITGAVGRTQDIPPQAREGLINRARDALKAEQDAAPPK